MRRWHKTAVDYLREGRAALDWDWQGSADRNESRLRSLGPLLWPDASQFERVIDEARAAMAAYDPGPLTADIDKNGVVWLFRENGAPHSIMPLETFKTLRAEAEAKR